MTISITVEPPEYAAFFKHLAKYRPKAVALTVQSDGQPQGAGISNAPPLKHDQQAALRRLGLTHFHSTASQTSP